MSGPTGDSKLSQHFFATRVAPEATIDQPLVATHDPNNFVAQARCRSHGSTDASIHTWSVSAATEYSNPFTTHPLISLFASTLAFVRFFFGFRQIKNLLLIIFTMRFGFFIEVDQAFGLNRFANQPS